MPHSQVSSSASDFFSDSGRTSSVNAFHKPNRSTTLMFEESNYNSNNHLSPAIEGFSFDDLDTTATTSTTSEQPQIPPVIGSSFEVNFDESPHAVQLDKLNSKSPDGMAQPDSNSSKRRTQYFEDSLAYKEGQPQSTKEKVQRDSPVIAELRTNVIIKDEFTVVTNLSQHLAERYRRPESSIMITVTHSACLMMGGSFEPAYILTITAIPSEVQPVTNKRNAYLMQHFVADTLHVSSSRGIVRFMEIPEERLATNGSTIAGDIERVEATNGVGRTPTNKSSRKSLIPSKRKSLIGRKNSDELDRKSSVKSTKSLKSTKSVKGKTSPPVPLQPAPEMRNSHTAGSIRDSSPAPAMRGESPANGFTDSGKATSTSPINSPSRPTTANRPGSSRRHLSTISGNVQDFPAPPPVPENDPAPKISKRKSIIAMFKRGEAAKSA